MSRESSKIALKKIKIKFSKKRSLTKFEKFKFIIRRIVCLVLRKFRKS